MKDTVFIRSQNIFTKIRLSDIRWIRQNGHQVEIQTDRQLKLLRIPFEKMITHYDVPNIVRVHQAYAININFIDKIEKGKIVVQGTSIPVAENILKQMIALFPVLSSRSYGTSSQLQPICHQKVCHTIE